MRLLVARYHWCTGCHACELACRQEHGHSGERYGLRIAQRGPLRREGEWQLDFVPRPTARCDLCAARAQRGREPACVACCPSRCLIVAGEEALPQLRARRRTGEKVVFWGSRSKVSALAGSMPDLEAPPRRSFEEEKT